MPSPFPGMDPYVERPAIWADFHDSLIAAIRGLLQPRLKPKYVALTQDRLYVVNTDRPMKPDVSVLRTPTTQVTAAEATMAVLEPDAGAVFELQFEDMREPYLEILETGAGNRVVTAIEVLSPSNKVSSAGRHAYSQKQQELWDNGANLVEIDLLRAGEPSLRLSFAHLDELRPWHYLVGVTRRKLVQQVVYPIRLSSRLPRIPIPVGEGDPDVTLDLQAAFTRCWDEGPYPEILFYDQPPTGRMAPEDLAWCEEILRNTGYRPPLPPPNS